MISKKEIENALKKIIHPEINFSLIELGMIKDIEIKNSKVSITFILPFLEIPIKNDLINLIKESIEKLDKNIKIKIKIAGMSKKEKEKFLKLANEGWAI